MSDFQEVAEKLKEIIKSHGGYDKVSEKIGINRQTLIRIATAKTDPKLSQVMKIVSLSSFTLDEILYEDAAPLIKDISKTERQRTQNTTVQELVYHLRDNLNKKYQTLEEDMNELITECRESLQKEIDTLKIEVASLKQSK